MTAADITLIAFTLCNSARVVAYVPQIRRAATDRNGAQAISFATWGLFLLSNISAVAYALVNKQDWTMASMFLCNAVGCAAIILIGARKRSQYRSQVSEQPEQVATGPQTPEQGERWTPGTRPGMSQSGPAR